jgi:hypothetical protein
MKMLRVNLTRAELLAMHLAMGLMWMEHKLEHDPEARPLRSALMKFNTAFGTWDGEGTAKLVLVAGENSTNPEHIKYDVLSFQPKVKREVLAGEVQVQWNCFCKALTESCQFCRGCGHIDQWMPADMLGYLKDRTYLVRGRRDVQPSPA